MDMTGNIVLLAFLTLLAWQDHKTKQVPLSLLLLGSCCGGIFWLLDAILFNAGTDWKQCLVGLLAGLLPGLLLTIAACLLRGRIGVGDGLAFLVCGLFLPAERVWGLMFLSFLIAAAAAVILLAGRKKTGKDHFAFLPCLLAAHGTELLLQLAA